MNKETQSVLASLLQAALELDQANVKPSGRYNPGKTNVKRVDSSASNKESPVSGDQEG